MAVTNDKRFPHKHEKDESFEDLVQAAVSIPQPGAKTNMTDSWTNKQTVLHPPETPLGTTSLSHDGTTRPAQTKQASQQQQEQDVWERYTAATLSERSSSSPSTPTQEPRRTGRRTPRRSPTASCPPSPFANPEVQSQSVPPEPVKSSQVSQSARNSRTAGPVVDSASRKHRQSEHGGQASPNPATNPRFSQPGAPAPVATGQPKNMVSTSTAKYTTGPAVTFTHLKGSPRAVDGSSVQTPRTDRSSKASQRQQQYAAYPLDVAMNRKGGCIDCAGESDLHPRSSKGSGAMPAQGSRLPRWLACVLCMWRD